MADPENGQLLRHNRITVLALLAMLAGMGGLTAAAVPLYQIFCQVTGFGGSTQAVAEAPAVAAERLITVRFNADVGRDLPWTFKPDQRAITLKVGETGIAVYTAENTSDAVIAGSAVFNVTPHKAGRYFSKIACFCFDQQLLGPGERVEMPVTFFVDPSIMADANLEDVNTITLSYTFFRTSKAPELAADEGIPSFELASTESAVLRR
ncbi:MAG: cytochrome c oxidase assembly protein [Pseudomonadota bacterium]|nr:cytochrome c oxidase assembly protein [Pseudomonadota bacterium]